MQSDGSPSGPDERDSARPARKARGGGHRPTARGRLRRTVGRIRRRASRDAGWAVRRTAAALHLQRLPTLDEIGLATGTDKASTTHDYLRIYEQAFGHLRDERIEVLEIGVHKAASLRMWERYFHRARIIGVDRKKACRQFANDRVTIEIGDQGDEEMLRRLGSRYRPTLLIDDGSHRWDHQILTFRTLWPAVQPGGFFVMEDVHTSFGDHRQMYGEEGAESAYDYLAGIVEGVVARAGAAPPRDDFEAYCRATIAWAQFLGHSIIVRKQDFPQPWFKRVSVADLPESAIEPGSRFAVEAGSYERVPGRIVNADPDVAQAFERLASGGTVACEPAASAVVRDVDIHWWGPTTTRDGVILAESLNAAQNLRFNSGLYRPWGAEWWVGADPRSPRRQPLPADGRIPVLLRQAWDRNYGHWLIDAFGRIAAIRDRVDLGRCQFLVNHQTSEPMRQVVLDSFSLIGVREDQVTFCRIVTHHYDRLLVPGTIAETPNTKSPLVIRFLEDVAAAVEPRDGDRIYLSRAKATRRRLLDGGAVVRAVEERGYRVVHPEDLGLREQIATLRGATRVVADMGAALANLAFSPRGVAVLALATQAMRHDYFYDIVCHKQGRYRGLQGRAHPAVDGAVPTLADDFEIDLGLLEQALDWLESGDARDP